MKWNDMRRSDNVEDVRESETSSPVSMGRVGLGGLLFAFVIGLIFRVNPIQVLSLLEGRSAPPRTQTQTPSQPIHDRDSEFVRAVLGDTEDTWKRIFQQQVGSPYQPPRLVLFRNGVSSACGYAQTAAGPFYCPADRKVYLDMGFFQHIQATAGSKADFARAYAISHEVGHHVQNLLGVSTKVRHFQAQTGKVQANALSVKMELQADCLSGVWGHYTAQRGLITGQDVETALNTAAQIGDDYLQKQARGYAVPESFTHGTSQQRTTWFTRGLKTGNIKQCDTFAAN